MKLRFGARNMRPSVTAIRSSPLMTPVFLVEFSFEIPWQPRRLFSAGQITG
jgi:hypothetical protein